MPKLKGVAFLLWILPTAAQTPAPHQTMDQEIRAAMAGFPASVSLYAKNLDSGATYGIREDERVRTASTIKLPIMAAIFHEVAENRAKWNEELILHEADKISGSGVIRELSDGTHLSIRDLMHMMIVVSDNTATNLLLDRFSADKVNAYMAELGLRQTRALRKIQSDGSKPTPSGVSEAGRREENKRFGLGVSTPREMVTLLEMLERGQAVSAAASREMIEVLKRQQYKDGIGRKVEFPVASKSGALDRLRSDAGIVYAPGRRIVIAITCDNLPATDYSPDNAGNIFISRVTGMLIDGLSNRQSSANATWSSHASNSADRSRQWRPPSAR